MAAIWRYKAKQNRKKRRKELSRGMSDLGLGLGLELGPDFGLSGAPRQIRGNPGRGKHNLPKANADFFPTLPWATEVLFSRESFSSGVMWEPAIVWEPACGNGALVDVMRKHCPRVYGTDLHNRGAFDGFLGGGPSYNSLGPVVAETFGLAAPHGVEGTGPIPAPSLLGPPILGKGEEEREVALALKQLLKGKTAALHIITNPPYTLAEAFIQRSLQILERRAAETGQTCKAAFLLRLAFLESISRYETLYKIIPPRRVWVFSESPTFHLNGHVPDKTARAGAKGVGSGSAAYAWYVWEARPPYAHDPHKGGAPFLGRFAPGFKPKANKAGARRGRGAAPSGD